MKIDASKVFKARECPSCACQVPANNNRCPICGYAFPQPSPGKRAMRIWGAILMLILFVILTLSVIF